MGSCPKCGMKIKKKRKSEGVRWCPRHGPTEKEIKLENGSRIIFSSGSSTLGKSWTKELLGPEQDPLQKYY